VCVLVSCSSQPSINDKCKWLSKPINYRNSRGHLYGCDCWRQTNLVVATGIRVKRGQKQRGSKADRGKAEKGVASVKEPVSLGPVDVVVDDDDD